ncbi:BCD family MFS transporter [Candidatus Chloroploca sp. M-50]|uniref:BCD family MFS transporter n=1 Tax=Candidatus Chloroploca mongolica TaxID=2528176 RepID=A0ABS4DEC1_9CHLR|nr:BCD family MFS transporter [Candidatus Chloroploca mongolica]MBP1467794.1 BCD family MFS transporter [Candidatus Chloroploca mongolica]
MNIVTNFRLGLLHVAVAVCLVPITGILNRIMIHEMQLMATLVAGLIVLPNLMSPLQPFLGQYSDHHPLFGYRRTPYIALGLLLCITGSVLTPIAALTMDATFWPGLAFSVLAFALWGLGYNLSVVSYLSLASDMSGENDRSRTIAVMWFMMITAVIFTATITGRALENYSSEALVRVFMGCGLVAFVLSAIGLIGLEPRNAVLGEQARHSVREAVGAVVSNPQAQVFFVYLMLLLAAILGQDVLLEPFGAQAFGMSVRETTQLTAIWGSATLFSLLLQGLLLSRFLAKKTAATIGAAVAACGFILIASSGLLHMQPLFILGIVVLGLGTGIATTTNLALMLDMTTPANVGLFIGAWGMADAAARGVGNVMAGAVRDVMSVTLGSPVGAYVTVFTLEALMLCAALVLLQRIDVSAFRGEQQKITTLIAVAGDA